jgi:hypothetical protein
VSDRAAHWLSLGIVALVGVGLQLASVVVTGAWMSAQTMGSIMGISAFMGVIERNLRG